MKSIYLLITFWLLALVSYSQNSYLDSLGRNLASAKQEDTNRVKALFAISDYYGFIQFDTCIYYSTQTEALSEKLNYAYGHWLASFSTFHAYNSRGNYPMALQAALQGMKWAEEMRYQHPGALTQSYYFMGLLNLEMLNYEESKRQFMNGINWQHQNGQPVPDSYACYSQMAILNLRMNQPDSALWYAQQGYELGKHSTELGIYYPLAITVMGNVYLSLNDNLLAGNYFRMALKESENFNNLYFQCRNYNLLASTFDRMNQHDSCIYYAKKALQICQQHNFANFTVDASQMLTKMYSVTENQDSTLKYMRIMLAAKDSVFSQSKGQQFQQLAYNEILHQQEANTARERYTYQLRTTLLLASLALFLVLAIMSFLNARRKQKDNLKIESAMKDLKATQSQLIHAEKMASLGELTAGIAHEIQNPLNFVNNFSEVNAELLEEMKGEIEKGHSQAALEIAGNITDNEQKISRHGKRADAIVKSMLRHSQVTSGAKILTDLNTMAGEFFRLAYRGFRARDPAFNVTMQTNFDPELGMVNLIPEEIGRVLVNLYNNSFYEVYEKKKREAQFDPCVEVSTKKLKDKVEIRIRDNGDGIPNDILKKIFQPFYTTKPTGQGTGLGLSLSYDVIKAHGGEIQVETKEGQFTVFTVILPV